MDRYFYNADWMGPLSVKNVVPLEIAHVVNAADLRFLPPPQYSARARGAVQCHLSQFCAADCVMLNKHVAKFASIF
jgi:hypothetical protein